MELVGVMVVVGEDGNLREAGVIQRLSEQPAVVGQAAVSHVFSHADGNVFGVIFPALESCECFSDDHLGRKADIVMYILLAVADRFLPSQLQRFGAQPLSGEGGGHDSAECVGGVGNQNQFFPVGGGEFYRIGLRKPPHFLFFPALPS